MAVCTNFKRRFFFLSINFGDRFHSQSIIFTLFRSNICNIDFSFEISIQISNKHKIAMDNKLAEETLYVARNMTNSVKLLSTQHANERIRFRRAMNAMRALRQSNHNWAQLVHDTTLLYERTVVYSAWMCFTFCRFDITHTHTLSTLMLRRIVSHSLSHLFRRHSYCCCIHIHEMNRFHHVHMLNT